MLGIPTEAVKAHSFSGHDGLTQQAGVTAPVEQMRNYAQPTVPLFTLGDRWASGKLHGMPRIPALGPRRAPYRVLGGSSTLGLETSLQRLWHNGTRLLAAGQVCTTVVGTAGGLVD